MGVVVSPGAGGWGSGGGEGPLYLRFIFSFFIFIFLGLAAGYSLILNNGMCIKFLGRSDTLGGW